MSNDTLEDKLEKLVDNLSTSVQLSFGHVEEYDPPQEDAIGIPLHSKVVAVFSFSEKGFGFGEFRIVFDAAANQHYIDTESMSKERIKRYLCALVDSAISDVDVGIGGEPFTPAPKDIDLHRKYHAAMGGGWCPNCNTPPPTDDCDIG